MIKEHNHLHRDESNDKKNSENEAPMTQGISFIENINRPKQIEISAEEILKNYGK